MAKGIYGGVSSKARKCKKAYVGVSSKARKVKKAYIGDTNGKAKLCYSAFSGKFGLASYDGMSHTTYDGTTASTSTHDYNTGGANISIVYCNGYWWGFRTSNGQLYRSSDFISWTQVSLSGASPDPNSYNDGSIIADNRYLYMRESVYYITVYDTETQTVKKRFNHVNYTLTSFGLVSNGKIILSWNTISSPTSYYYTIYDATTDTESSMIGTTYALRFPKYAVSEDRVVLQSNYTLGYFKNNTITLGSTPFYNNNDGWQGIVYGNGIFTTGYATSTDGINYSASLQTDNRSVLAFGDGIFIRFYNANAGVKDLQISENGISWTTILTGVACSQYTSSANRQSSAAFKPM